MKMRTITLKITSLLTDKNRIMTSVLEFHQHVLFFDSLYNKAGRGREGIYSLVLKHLLTPASASSSYPVSLSIKHMSFIRNDEELLFVFEKFLLLQHVSNVYDKFS